MSPPRSVTLVQAHPHVPGPDHTCPGSGVPAAAVLAGPDPGQRPPGTGAQLASYAGLAPVTRRSGSSIRGEHVSHGGNKRLKRAMFLSAFASLRSDPVSQAYYQRKRDQGKRHNQAVLALAHRRILTLHAMIRNGTLGLLGVSRTALKAVFQAACLVARCSSSTSLGVLYPRAEWSRF